MTATLTASTTPSADRSVAAAAFERDGYLSIESLTAADDIALIRSLLDPLFEKFDSLGERAVDLAGPREPGVPPRSPEVNETVILEPRLRSAYGRLRLRLHPKVLAAKLRDRVTPGR